MWPATFAVENLPNIGGLSWEVSYNPTSVVLSVLTPFTADFDLDGDVNADDLAKWQSDFGGAGSDADADGDSDGADFLAWQQQLGVPARRDWRNPKPSPSRPPSPWHFSLLPFSPDELGTAPPRWPKIASDFSAGVC